MDKLNSRVLIIDDEEMVRDNIEEILIPHRQEKNLKVDDALDLLFDEEKQEEAVLDNKQFPDFRVDKAQNGQVGLEKVKTAVEAGDPYAVIFLGMRMPILCRVQRVVSIRDLRHCYCFVTSHRLS